MKAKDFVAQALKKIGVVAEGEAASASQLSDGMISLRGLLDSWSNSKLIVPNVVTETLTLVPGQQTYTIGTGGEFATPRPVSIENIQIRDASGLDSKVDLVTQEEWAGIALKSSAGKPSYSYFERTAPLGKINFWPVPSEASTIVLNSKKQFADTLNSNDELNFGPGYDRAIIFNLTVDIAPEYGKPVAAEVLKIANDSYAALCRTNSSAVMLKSDMVHCGRPNIFTGGRS